MTWPTAVLQHRERYALAMGDAADLLRDVPDASVDALVCDPPAGIAFRGEHWDRDRGGRARWVSWLKRILARCHRALLPGHWALVWALPRTAHWTALAVEEAGFEIRDVIAHLQGQGFPKSDTSLKPAAEHWILARKPGRAFALGIEACRAGDTAPGRYPANVVLSHNADCSDGCTYGCPVAALDAQSGELQSGALAAGTPRKNHDSYSGGWGDTYATTADIEANVGGASRFFYCAKAKGSERTSHPTEKHIDLMRWLVRLVCPPGGVVLDPFAGSGTTLVAALAQERRALGCEQNGEYVEIAHGRCREHTKQLQLFSR